MKKVVLTFGLIAGAIISTVMLLSINFSSDLKDFGMAEILGFASIFLALSVIFFAIKSYRDNYNGGVISFGKAFLIGLYITAIASAIHTTGWMVYYQAGPGKEFMEEYFDAQAEKVTTSGMTEEEKENKLAEMETQRKTYSNPIMMALLTFFTEVPTGGIPISLICALILMRKKPK